MAEVQKKIRTTPPDRGLLFEDGEGGTPPDGLQFRGTGVAAWGYSHGVRHTWNVANVVRVG